MLYFLMGPSNISYRAANWSLDFTVLYLSFVSVWGVEGRSYMSSQGSSMMVSLNYFCLRGFIGGCCLLLLGRVVKGISYANVLRGSI